MRRVLFCCWGISVYSYPAMLYVGIVLGIYAELYAARSIGMDVPATLAATLALLTAALMGARLLWVLPNWKAYRQHPRRILQCSDGGASMYGGLLLAFPISVPVLAMLNLPFGTFWDLASFTMLLGMVVTRIGCLLNGCCGGRPTSRWWGVNLPDHKGVWRRRIPVQILEIIWGSLVVTGAIALWGRQPFQGAIFFYTIGAYGFGRALMESMRDEQDRVGNIRLHRLISTGLVAASLGAFAIGWGH